MTGRLGLAERLVVHQYVVGVCLNRIGILGTKGKNETLYRERLDRLADLYKPDALCEVFADKTKDDAFELFYRLNKGGTSFKAGDVEGARLSSAPTKKIVGPMRAVAGEKEMKMA